MEKINFRETTLLKIYMGKTSKDLWRAIHWYLQIKIKRGQYLQWKPFGREDVKKEQNLSVLEKHHHGMDAQDLLHLLFLCPRGSCGPQQLLNLHPEHHLRPLLPPVPLLQSLPWVRPSSSQNCCSRTDDRIDLCNSISGDCLVPSNRLWLLPSTCSNFSTDLPTPLLRANLTSPVFPVNFALLAVPGHLWTGEGNQDGSVSQPGPWGYCQEAEHSIRHHSTINNACRPLENWNNL